MRRNLVKGAKYQILHVKFVAIIFTKLQSFILKGFEKLYKTFCVFFLCLLLSQSKIPKFVLDPQVSYIRDIVQYF